MGNEMLWVRIGRIMETENLRIVHWYQQNLSQQDWNHYKLKYFIHRIFSRWCLDYYARIVQLERKNMPLIKSNLPCVA